MITLNAHALNRVVPCNGSVHMPDAEFDPETNDSDDRREGIAAHYVATEVLSGRFSDPIEFVDRQAPNGVYITPDMAEHVDKFVSDVMARGLLIETESTVNFHLTPQVYINCRLDVATYDPNSRTLTIDEFKYGWRLVEPFENWQLFAEAFGWIVNNGLQPLKVVLNIHQPRPHHAEGHKREWSMSYVDFQLISLKLTFLLENVETNHATQTGEHCYQCPALNHCAASRASEYNTLEAVGFAFNDRLTDEELSVAALLMERAEEIAKQKKTAYRELITHRISTGKIFQSWYREPQYGNTTWNKGVTASMIKAVSGIDISKPDMLSPTQAKKLLVPETIIKAFSDRPYVGQKLTHKTASQAASKYFPKPT